MKSQIPEHEIESLLRGNMPALPNSPALESRILRALHERQQPKTQRWWPWLLLPPAAAAVALMLPRAPTASHQSTAIVSQQPFLPSAFTAPEKSVISIAPTLSLIDAKNPLKTESIALGRDARRVGDFLIDCLPSVASRGE